MAGGAGQRPAPTFNRDVAPIIYGNCASCHRPGESAPFSLLTYDDVKGRAGLIAQATTAHVMPPWQPESREGEFDGERRLSPAGIATLQEWAEAGAPEGDPDHRPAPPHFANAWQLGTPDVVITMDQPFAVPADGPDVFRNFVLAVPISERKFVRAFEFRPGNARVLHHARVLIDDTGDVRRFASAHGDVGPADTLSGTESPAAAGEVGPLQPGFGGMDVPGARFPDGHFLGWAPGKRADRETFPWPIEPGTDFVVQMHLKPSGRVERVQASIGLYLTDTPPPAVPLMVRLGSKTIDIPAGDASYDVNDSYVLPVDVTALSIYPHAHYLAKEMTVTARRPNGSVQTLLHIPNWNFNWQDEYQYTQPIPLPRGTTITMRFTYDNSEQNPHNPTQPPRRVRFGSETVDEMGELLLQVLPKNAADLPRLRADVARKNLLTDVAGEEKRIADVPDDVETRNALGVAYAQLGRVQDGLAQFQQSIRIAPGSGAAHYNIGVIAMGEKRYDEAREHFEQALAARPDHAEAHNNLGVLLESQGQMSAAVAHYEQALAARPSHAAAHNNLGRVLLGQGRVADATQHFRAALRTRPDNADALYNLGRALIASGQPREAVREWRRALAVRPDSVAILADMAWLLVTNVDVRDPIEGAHLAERANKAAGGANPAVLDILATAYAASDRLELAIRTAQQAFQRAMAAKNSALAGEIRQRLELYQQRRLTSGAERSDSGNP
jgi:tetratricopeptide (TPR) repeat protein